MKKNRIIKTICFLITLFSVSTVHAGSVALHLNGESTVKVGQTFDITVEASSISGFNGGLATVQGDISFDQSYIEYMKYSGASSPLSVSYGVSTKRFVALGMSGESIKSTGSIFTLTFKALHPGKTNVSINNMVVGDTKAIVHTATTSPKQITIVEDTAIITPTPTSKPNTNTNTKPVSGEVKQKSTVKSSVKTLEYLRVNNAIMTPTFDKTITEYTIIVEKDTDKLLLDYAASNSNAKVKVIGNESLKTGEISKVEIEVTAEDGSTQKYILNVKKEGQQEKRGLSKLTAKEGKLSPKFDTETFEYTIVVGKKVKKLTLDIVPVDKDSKIEIIGNKNFEFGKNDVLVKVTDKDGFINYYTLHVKKPNTMTLFGIHIGYIIGGLLLFLFLLFLLFKKKKKEEKVEKIIVEPITLRPQITIPDENDFAERIAKKIEENKAVMPKAEEKPIIEPIKEEELKTETFLHPFYEEKTEPVEKKKEEDDYVARHTQDFIEKSQDDLYDDVVTKEELIGAIEEGNAKKLNMLMKQEEVNKLKEELKKEEGNE